MHASSFTNVRTQYDCYLEECDENERSCFENGQCADKHAIYTVFKVDINPQYGRNTEERSYGSHDMALITLERVVSLTGTVIPICLPQKGQLQGLLSEKNMFVTGWGKLNSARKGSDVLQQLQVISLKTKQNT